MIFDADTCCFCVQEETVCEREIRDRHWLWSNFPLYQNFLNSDETHSFLSHGLLPGPLERANNTIHSNSISFIFSDNSHDPLIPISTETICTFILKRGSPRNQTNQHSKVEFNRRRRRKWRINQRRTNRQKSAERRV